MHKALSDMRPAGGRSQVAGEGEGVQTQVARGLLPNASRHRGAFFATHLRHAPLSRQSGFTLLELMIVISIIIILAIIVLPQYQKTVLQARESVLRDDLAQMRKLLDQYAADKGKLPQSLADLATEGYLREVPVDPMTGKAEWGMRSCYDSPDSGSWGGENVFDVYSKSQDTALNGQKYSDW